MQPFFSIFKPELFISANPWAVSLSTFSTRKRSGSPSRPTASSGEAPWWSLTTSTQGARSTTATAATWAAAAAATPTIPQLSQLLPTVPPHRQPQPILPNKTQRQKFIWKTIIWSEKKEWIRFYIWIMEKIHNWLRSDRLTPGRPSFRWSLINLFSGFPNLFVSKLHQLFLDIWVSSIKHTFLASPLPPLSYVYKFIYLCVCVYLCTYI